ncbi:Lipin/Ned1/Smp2-domain-containing protein [Phakopsora pachyrhizi]|uniref:Lipin/Ned1/Smp2-domain-containing protein n=1 Tax=Phakopsora pachyrhizi TaxID=170000 RepID=A0AAV0BPU2_PHAPC|nr:Lipin/Ned1/Smp2-domain-containing protein [Phakopsora pachyrhizi]
MSWIGRAISSVGQYYKEINPATLSGAIDIIVVSNTRRKSGESNDSGDVEVELACSPWHVRFGKLSVLRPIERKVYIVINGETAPFSMKIGETGEAFFVFETDVEDLPEDLQTSPLVSPVLKSAEEPPPNLNTSNRQDLESVPEFNDLGESHLSENSQKLNQPKPLEKKQEIDSLKSQDAPNCQLGSSRDHPSLVSGISILQSNSQHDFDENETSQCGKVSDLLGSQEHSLNEMKFDISEDLEYEDGEEVRKAAKAKVPEISSTSNSPLETPSDPHGTELFFGQPSATGARDLMLDMEGYKTTNSKEKFNGRLQDLSEENSNDRLQSILRTDEFSESSGDLPEPFLINGNSDQLKEDGLMNFTKALLRCSEQISNYLSIISSGRTEIRENIDDIVNSFEPNLSITPAAESSSDKLISDTEGLTRLCEGLITVQSAEDEDGLGRYDRFKLDSNGTSHIFEVSLFSSHHEERNYDSNTNKSPDTFRFSRKYNQQKFKENSMTFDDFFTPNSKKSSRGSNFPKHLLDEEVNYIVKYNDRFILTWDNASTALTSLGIYRKSLVSLSQACTVKLVNGILKVIDQKETQDFLDAARIDGDIKESKKNVDVNRSLLAPALPPTSSSGRPWSRWWYKSDSLNSTDLNSHLRASSEIASSAAIAFKPQIDGQSAVTTNLPPPRSSQSHPPSQPGATAHDTLNMEEYDESPKPPETPSIISSPEPNPQDSSDPDYAAEKSNKIYAKTLRLTSDQLKQLGLKKGMNQVSFSVRSSYSGYAVCNSRIFLWESDYKICISDIDGTITKSDALGHVLNMIGRDWTHPGVAKLYTDIARNGYKIMYLTSRAIGQANTTREYLKGINQMGFTLPDGPVIMSPDRLMTSLHREVIMRKPEVFKMACLRDIQRLFGQIKSPFYAGFGNRITDALSYRSVGVPSSKIFTIDSNGEVKMELLELTGYKSSYIHMTDLVDQMFPPINTSSATPEYTDFNYWRTVSADYGSMLLKDLDVDDILSYNPCTSTASPSPSSRSGKSLPPATSRLTFRLSSLSLVRKSSKNELHRPTSRSSLKSGASNYRGTYREASPASSSMERILREESPNKYNELKRSGPHNESFTALDSGSEDDDYQVSPRLRSDSMPGSLPGSLEEASMLEGSRVETFKITPRRNIMNLEQKKKGSADDDNEVQGSVNNDETIGDDEDDFPQMDFSSVPVSPISCPTLHYAFLIKSIIKNSSNIFCSFFPTGNLKFDK